MHLLGEEVISTSLLTVLSGEIMFPVSNSLSGGAGNTRVKEYGFTSFLPPPSVSSLPLGIDCKFVKKSPVKLLVVHSGFTVVSLL